MTIFNNYSFFDEAAANLEAAETQVSSTNFAYTLGVNLHKGDIAQLKIYIRFFEKNNTFLKFFKIFDDKIIRQMATNDFKRAESIAFDKKGLGFKGFTLGIVKDFETNHTGYGWGARATSIITGPYFYGYRFCNDFLTKKSYKYIRGSRRSLKLPFLTEMVEVQESSDGKSDKYCLCPDINRTNLSQITNSMEKNLSSGCKLYHQDIIKRNSDLSLVNMGIGKEEEKLYYHNFKKSNKIKNYLLNNE